MRGDLCSRVNAPRFAAIGLMRGVAPAVAAGFLPTWSVSFTEALQGSAPVLLLTSWTIRCSSFLYFSFSATSSCLIFSVADVSATGMLHVRREGEG